MRKFIYLSLCVTLCSACQSFNSVKNSLIKDAQETSIIGEPVPTEWMEWAVVDYEKICDEGIEGEEEQ